MKYRGLMQGKDEIGMSPVRCALFGDGNDLVLSQTNRYSFIFVLQGEVELTFKLHNTTCVVAAQMIVLDKEQVEQMRCKGDTIVLEFEVLGRMTTLMQGTSKAFNLPCSEIIIFNDSLHGWCGRMMEDILKNMVFDNDYYKNRCNELTQILLTYSRSILGTLYIPLYACSLQCDNCFKVC